MISIEDLRIGARMHRKHSRVSLVEYGRNFSNAEYFLAIDDESTLLIEPLGWSLRALEPDGLKEHRAVPPGRAKAIARDAGLDLVARDDPRFPQLWNALLDWAATKNIKPLSARMGREREDETFFFVAPSTK
ncbi:hypothetical protein [Maritimibacter sp. HL-12]|uniref:hypothetical protein n=1 Tax=Maritimibacter sp. HL-12 TaxID=1162418 RepID=UPI00111C6997|nr:hypothetical protein [Maritimibacter sp. HL-12]